MHLTIAFKNRRPSEDLAWQARRTLAFALDRFAHRIAEVALRITDVNGPRGGADQQCQLAIQVAGGRTLVLRDLDSSPERCVHRLARRAARLLARLGSLRPRGRGRRGGATR